MVRKGMCLKVLLRRVQLPKRLMSSKRSQAEHDESHIIPTLRTLRQEDCEFKANYIMSSRSS
jgi:hypothetical protein